MNENIEYKLKKLLVDFEEMEKRIKANKNLLDKSSQNIKDEIAQEIQTISQEITSCKTLVSELETSVTQNSETIEQNTTQITQNTQNISQNTQNIAQNTTNITQNTADIAQNAQDIADNTSKITQNSTKITEINTKIGDFSQINEKITQISTSIENLSQIINNLQLNDNSQLIYQDVGVNEDFVEVSENTTVSYSNFYSQSYFLICDQNQYIDIDFELEYDPTSENKYNSNNYTIELLVNDVSILSESNSLKSSSAIHKLSTRYYPTQKINEIRVHCNGNRYTIVKYYKIIAKGKNLTFVGQTPSIAITCFDNKYYICNKSDPNDTKLYFAELEKDNLTLDTSNYQWGDLKYTDFNEKIAVYPTYKLATGEFVTHWQNTFYFPTLESRYKTNNCYLHAYRDYENKQFFAYYVDINLSACDYDFLFTGKEPCYACFCFTNTLGNPYIFATPEQNKYNRIPLKMNGEKVPSVYFKCAMVKDNNITSSTTSVNFHGAIFWNRTTQNWEFFETYDNTYKVILSPGKYCTAYYQSDDSINVYISRGCTTYKYVLVKNTETGQYELSNTFSIIPECTKYDELYDGKALVTCYNSYSIYSPNDSE